MRSKKLTKSELRYFRNNSCNSYVRKPRARWRWFVRNEWKGTTFTDRFLAVKYADMPPLVYSEAQTVFTNDMFIPIEYVSNFIPNMDLVYSMGDGTSEPFTFRGRDSG